MAAGRGTAQVAVVPPAQPLWRQACGRRESVACSGRWRSIAGAIRSTAEVVWQRAEELGTAAADCRGCLARPRAGWRGVTGWRGYRFPAPPTAALPRAAFGR